MSGQVATITLQTKDAFGNRCSVEGDHFDVRITPVKSLVPELEQFLKKVEVPHEIEDLKDGSHVIRYTPQHAGFYRIDITHDAVPVGKSPYTACVFNASIAFPKALSFYPMVDQTAFGEEVPARPAYDCCVVDDKMVVLQSDPVLPGQMRHVEYLHFLKITGDAGNQWQRLQLRKGVLAPPPATRAHFAIDQAALACLAQSDPAAPIDEVRVLDLSSIQLSGLRALDASRQATGDFGWIKLACSGQPPNAVAGAAVEVWEGRHSILVSGGVGADGKVLADVFMLQMDTDPSGPCSWRTLAEWPASMFSGDGACARCDHTITFFPDSAFYLFGGRDAHGNLLDDLHIFDIEAASWSRPAMLGELPMPRYNHASCVIAKRYLVIHGGINRDGECIESTSVYDTVTAHWHTVEGMEPRSQHRLQCRGGVMYVIGGLNAEGKPVSAVPLCSDFFPFAQKAAMDFCGNKEQAVIITPSARLQGLKNVFAIECAFFARGITGVMSLATKADTAAGGFKNGFGLLLVEHPAYKGDPEEGSRVHFFIGEWGPTKTNQRAMVRVETEEWYHVCGVYDGNELRLFLNGTFKDTCDEVIFTEEDIEAGSLHSKGEMHIGGIPGKYAFDGYVDEVRVWDIVRSEEEIRASMNNTFVGKTEGLVGQWTFNEGSLEQIVDSSQCRSMGHFEKYAGGVELRRVQSTRPKIEYLRNEREKHIDAAFLKLQKWKKTFEERNGREPTKADMMLAEPEIVTVARRLGEMW